MDATHVAKAIGLLGLGRFQGCVALRVALRRSNTMSNKMRSEHSFRIAAQKYVNDQLGIMKKYGSCRPISLKEYGRLVGEIMEIGKRMWIASGGKIEHSGGAVKG
jgi:hypothetical protein